MSYGVQILETIEIPLPPPPAPLTRVKLSLFDSFWMMLPPVQKLLLYTSNPNNTPFSALVEDLKSSLSSVVLRSYLPLAGRLVHVPSANDVEIDLSDPKLTFLVAESDLDLARLAASEIHDVRSFMKLVPSVDVSLLPFPAFAVQVTRFGCGGLAIGYAVHHAVADGKGMMQFLEAWAKSCKAKMCGGGGDELLADADAAAGRGRALYDRSVIRHPNGDELARKFLHAVARELPKTPAGSIASIEESRLACSRRTFVLDAQSIQSLKKRATELTDSNAATRPPSTFSVVSAHTWICYARTRQFDPAQETALAILMDCRARLDPPLHEDYFANCLVPNLARLLTSELLEEDGLARACSASREAIREASKDPLRHFEHFFDNFNSVPFDRMVNVTASPRFKVYDIDFGWGKPARFEAVSMNLNGEFALVAGKEEGSVQVSVVTAPDQIETFADLFLSGLSA